MNSKVFICGKLERFMLNIEFFERLSLLSPTVSLAPLPLVLWVYSDPAPLVTPLLCFSLIGNTHNYHLLSANKSQTTNFKLQSPCEICFSPVLSVNSKNSCNPESPNHNTNLFHSAFLLLVNYHS